MPDIFISYKKEERDVAARLATRLVEAGYDVWWDAALLAGDHFEDEISSVLANSRAVIILWSRRSVASDWVKAEAESARQQKKALPVIIDDLPIDSLPLLYRGVHVAQLRDWQGDDAHAGFGELMKSVNDRLGAARGPELTAPQAQAGLAASAYEAEIWAAIAAGNDPSADEYRAYLKRFGPNARFADLANIRIARLERESPPVLPPPRRRRRWWPAVVLPVLALLLIGAGGLWLANGLTLKTFTNMLVPQETRDAAARCRTWGAGGDLDWHAMVPVSSPFSLTDCQKAQAGFPDEGDYDGLLAMARIVDDPSAAADASALAQKGADLGSAIANDVLGVMYQAGTNFKPDFSKAASYFKVAADKG
ncbi:MAG TPA: TIR domain-containing protein, partial [Devosia sp.]|nr:TIR domain-containing protein [Devosia sp.]